MVKRGRRSQFDRYRHAIRVRKQGYRLTKAFMQELEVAFVSNHQAGSIGVELQEVLGALVRVFAKDPGADEPVRLALWRLFRRGGSERDETAEADDRMAGDY